MYRSEIASRGWHVYGKSVWKNPKKTDNRTAEKEFEISPHFKFCQRKFGQNICPKF